MLAYTVVIYSVVNTHYLQMLQHSVKHSMAAKGHRLQNIIVFYQLTSVEVLILVNTIPLYIKLACNGGGSDQLSQSFTGL